MNHLIAAHGNKLVNLLVENGRAEEVHELSRDWPSYDLEAHQLGDLELLLNGGFSPLQGYMGAADFQGACSAMRLDDGVFWPLPVTLDIPATAAESLSAGSRLALRDPEGVMLAVLHVSEVFEPDRGLELEALFGSDDSARPQAKRHMDRSARFAVAGRVEGLRLPVHYDYRELRLTPAELRRNFGRLGWRKVLAFQTHQTMHRTHHAMTQKTAEELGANLLIHPVVGLSGPGDADHYTRVRCYQALLAHYPKYMARLSLLPMAPRRGGAREALLQAIVHKNHGCTHFMVEPRHAASVLEVNGAPEYEQEEAMELVRQHHDDLQIEMVAFEEMVYLDRRKYFVRASEVPADARVLTMPGAEVRKRLNDGREIPDWYTFASVEKELRKRHPVRSGQGFTVFFTGLSGSGKSTVANALRVKLLELGGRGVTLLDGDLVRRNLSSELGFSKEHRDLNIRRIGFVASEITRAGGAAICAPIAPYDQVRRQVREIIEPCGGFILVHVATPLEVCESRDRKGMYAKARAGIIKEFTGISDPYEVPDDADVVIDTSDITPAEATREVLLYLEREGYLAPGEE